MNLGQPGLSLFRKRDAGSLAMLAAAVLGCGETAVRQISQGSRDLPQVSERLTAREALDLVLPLARGISPTPVLLLITSGFDIDAQDVQERGSMSSIFPTVPRRSCIPSSSMILSRLTATFE